jgi:hypothetical protein
MAGQKSHIEIWESNRTNYSLNKKEVQALSSEI